MFNKSFIDELLGISEIIDDYKSVDRFIEEHHHIEYTEAIITQKGLVVYCRPSHVETLIRLSGISKEKLDTLMPISASPIHWLVDYTKCIAVYYHGYMVPTGNELYPLYTRNGFYGSTSTEYQSYDASLTPEQRSTLDKLISRGLVADVQLN